MYTCKHIIQACMPTTINLTASSCTAATMYSAPYHLTPLTVAAKTDFFLLAGSTPPNPNPDPGIHILPIFQILYGPYCPYIIHIPSNI